MKQKNAALLSRQNQNTIKANQISLPTALRAVLYFCRVTQTWPRIQWKKRNKKPEKQTLEQMYAIVLSSCFAGIVLRALISAHTACISISTPSVQAMIRPSNIHIRLRATWQLWQCCQFIANCHTIKKCSSFNDTCRYERWDKSSSAHFDTPSRLQCGAFSNWQWSADKVCLERTACAKKTLIMH